MAFAVSNSPARADTTWTGAANSDWANAANWTNGVPTPSTDAFINNGGKANIKGPGATARSLTLGLNPGDSGTVIVDGTNGGSLAVPQGCPNEVPGIFPGLISVGYGGTGTLRIINGGAVACGYAYIAALASPAANANGTVTVDGPSSTWTISSSCGLSRLFVGGSFSFIQGSEDVGGTALLKLTNHGSVMVNNPSNSTAVKVGISGTLTGDGTITTPGDNPMLYVPYTTAVKGTLAPIGALTFFGNLAVTPFGTMLCNVTPQAQDTVAIYSTGGNTGTANLGGRLSVNMTGTFAPGAQYVLLHAETGWFVDPIGIIHNRFDSYSINYLPCQGFIPIIAYDDVAHNVILFLQPQLVGNCE